MRILLRKIYYFLPVQLLFLHLRRYQLLLLFWLTLVLALTDKLAAHFGASALFLAPEYLGKISYTSMFLMGSAFCVFMMMWHITTFIIHSKRMPYLGGTRHAFLVYCINNSAIPVAFMVFYSVTSVHFQLFDEHSPAGEVLVRQLGFYLGVLVVLTISFAYFFRISRDFFKNTLSMLASPAQAIKNIIPYDALDYEIDIIPARSYISSRFRFTVNEEMNRFQPKLMKTVLQRHHRNVIFATFIAYVILLLMGIYIDNPYLRVPAGSSFLLLFSIIMGLVGAFKYFLRSWETLGWVLFTLLLSTLVKYNVFDLRSIAYGLDYNKPLKQAYHYGVLRSLFTEFRYNADRRHEEQRLEKWKQRVTADTCIRPPLVVVTASGGGLRAAYWTFRALQYADSITGGKLFRNTVMITGASGGMIGASYWRNLHDAHDRGKLTNPYAMRYQENMGKDLLNPIVFSFASIDMISPFNKITVAGHRYTADRGYALEREMAENSDKLLDHSIGFFSKREAAGQIPELILAGTIVNDGRKLLICNQPVAFLTQPAYAVHWPTPPIDAVDFCSFFPEQDCMDLRLTSALRMNATFPYILPVVKLPSEPQMNIMDAGLRDNFGTETVSRYLYSLRGWLQTHTSNAIWLEIRDTRENDVSANSTQSTLGSMIADPLFVIQNKWEAFQSYEHSYTKDYSLSCNGKHLKIISLQYIPKEFSKTAALNFHLTQREKEDIYQSIYHPYNQGEIGKLIRLLGGVPPVVTPGAVPVR